MGYEVFDAWANATQRTGRNRSFGNVFFEDDTIYSYGYHFPLAIRLPWGFLLNGDTPSSTTAKHQADVRSAVRKSQRPYMIIPFLTLLAAGIVPRSVEFVNAEPDRAIPYACRRKFCVQTPHEHQAHRLGRSVFKVTGGVRNVGEDDFIVPDRYFLSGTDETMVNARRSYFMAELPEPAASVYQALEILKPPAVLAAERDGVVVKRQGEWFFIPTDLQTRHLPNDPTLSRMLPHRDATRRSRHTVTELRVFGGVVCVRGTVRHTAQDHTMLKLGTLWHSVHENCEIRSFRASGRVD